MPELKRPITQLAKRILFYGHKRYCNVCRQSWRRFLPVGLVTREEARCPGCNSLERHRLVWEFFQRRTDLLDGQPKRMLHVAPEPCLAPLFRRALGGGHVTADLLDPRADHAWDITQIPQPDGSFDVVYCSHVLEHVPDDRKAMAEFYRVLKLGGWAVLNVPITAEKTFEDPSITDPRERERLFGQSDHVRRYGLDYVDRLREVGFEFEVTHPSDLFSPQECEHLAVQNEFAGEVYYCRKR